MGVYIHYQSMRPDTVLLHRLQREPEFYSVYRCALHLPSGPFECLRYSGEEMADLIERLQTTGVFSDSLAARRAVEAFQKELHQAAEQDSGLPHRSLYLKITDDLEEYAQGLTTSEHPHLGDILLCGGEEVQFDYPGEVDGGLSLLGLTLIQAVGPLLPAAPKNEVCRPGAGNPVLLWQAFFREVVSRREVVVWG